MIQVCLHCTPETDAAPVFKHPQRFRRPANPVILWVTSTRCTGNPEEIRAKEVTVADTTKIEDKEERKKLKRAARKKAAPKAKRTEPRGSAKKKVKKMARGVSKR